MYENQPLKYSSMQNKDGYKLQVQVAGSPTNISAVAKTRTSKWVYSKTIWSLPKVCKVKMTAHVTP